MQPLVDPLEEVRRRRLIMSRLDEWLIQEIMPYLGARVLEIGSGHGNLVLHLLDRELVVATDVEPASVEITRSKFGSFPNFRACVYDVCDPVDDELRGLRVDTVLSLNVLEHIQHDRVALSHMAELLVAGGRVVLIVPAHDWLYGTMDRAIGHFRRYTRQAMSRALEDVGLAVEEQFYLNALGALGWFFNGRIVKQTIPPKEQLAWFNRLVPLLRVAEQRVRPPFGISLLSIAHKRQFA